MKKVILCFIGMNILLGKLNAQTIPAGFPVLEENARRLNLLEKGFKNYSFALRPIRNEEDVFSNENKIDQADLILEFPKEVKKKKTDFQILPLLNTTVFNSNRPFGWGNSALLNSTGWQSLTSPGVYGKLFFLQIQLRPELIVSQNKQYQGFWDKFSDNVTFARFRYWNFGDHPEHFGQAYQNFITPGQSYVSLNFGNVELGLGTQNIYWGPGQFSGLIFSDNARGIPHAFIRTSAPINIGIGHLEGQIISGRAEDSGIEPSQNQALNDRYFTQFSGDWRYVSGISLTYQPKFLRNFFIGFNRTFQQYNDDVEKSLKGRFPIFEVFQKEKLFQSGNSVDYDGLAQDQLVSIFFKFKSEKGRFEVYAEFGKHDHNFNWREFILNPEHARAYLFGFSKLIPLTKPDQYLQIRGEVIQQAESINRFVRYPVLGVLNTSWLTHYQVRGFSNYGESMGPGIGVGANAQILEISKVNGLNKLGVLLKRIENHQDFFYTAFDGTGKKPWIDMSLGALYSRQLNKFILSGSAQFVRAKNYQWIDHDESSLEFSKGMSLFTFSSQINVIYLFR